MANAKEDVKRLREETGAGVMDCKRALDEAGGDFARAKTLLKERGQARAQKTAGREAKEGIIEAYVHGGGRIGALVELSSETDFVARNQEFRDLAREIAMQVAATNPTRLTSSEPSADGDVPLLDQPYIRDPGKTVQGLINETIAKLRENVVLRRFARFELGG